MIKLLIFLWVFIILNVFLTNFTSPFIVRPLGGYGLNAGDASLNGGYDDSFLFGLQLITETADYERGFGVTFNYIRSYSPKNNDRINRIEFLSVDLFFETRVEKFLIIQLGPAVYFPTGYNDDIEIGLMIGIGTNFEFNNYFELPIFARFDLMNSRILNVNGVIGLTFKFGNRKKHSNEHSPNY